jgi:hypothetical protein
MENITRVRRPMQKGELRPSQLRKQKGSQDASPRWGEDPDSRAKKLELHKMRPYRFPSPRNKVQ